MLPSPVRIRSKPSSDLLMPTHVCKGRFKLRRRIGRGAFGQVYRATDTTTLKDYAVKLESVHANTNQLLGESRSCQYFCKPNSKFPTYVWSGWEGNYNIMVMQLLGPNLEYLLNLCGRQFPLKTILMLGNEMITRIEELHDANFIHSDIKPENFVIGRERKDSIFLVDFGLSKRYVNVYTREHIPIRDGKSLTGTARYCSIRSHKGVEQSRRDDLEALCYVLIYFLHGSLPWQGLEIPTVKEKYEKIYEMKRKISLSELCKSFPPEFKTIVSYCRNLKFDETPDYSYLRRLLNIMMTEANFKFDGNYEWRQKNGKLEEYLKRC